MMELVFRLFLFLLVHGVLSFVDFCPEPNVCVCDEMSIKCICDHRQNVTLTATLNNLVENIVVQGCDRVVLPLASMTHLQLNRMELVDINYVSIRPFALMGLQAVTMLRFSDIRKLDIKPHGLSGLTNASLLQIHNVSMETIPQWAFGGITDVGLFEITDSVIGTIEPLGFILSNVTSLRMANTSVENLMNSSMLIHNAENLNFDKCQFNYTDNSSFSLADIGGIDFINCHFGVIEGEMILAKHVRSFSFFYCEVDVFKEKGLSSMEVVEFMLFAGNIIRKAEIESIFPYFDLHQEYGKNNITLQVHENRFYCDCNLAWLWLEKEPLYSHLINTSYCFGPPELSHDVLTDLQPVWKQKDSSACVDIKSKSSFTPELPISTEAAVIVQSTSEAAMKPNLNIAAAGSSALSKALRPNLHHGIVFIFFGLWLVGNMNSRIIKEIEHQLLFA